MNNKTIFGDYIEPTKNYFDFDSISEVLKIIAKTRESDRVYQFVIGDKNYTINKNENTVVFSCSDGRLLKIGLSLEEYNINWDEYAEEVDLRGVVSISTKITDNSTLYFYNYFKWMKNYDDVERLSGNMINKGLKTQYAISKVYKTMTHRSFWFDTIGEKSANNGYPSIIKPTISFTNEGIRNYEGYLISDDCERIISKNGEKVPTLEEAKSYRDEVNKYHNIISQSDLSQWVKDKLFRGLESQFHYSEYLNLIEMYNTWLPVYKNVAYFRNILLEGRIKEYVFTKGEMETLVDALRKTLSDELSSYEEEKRKKEEEISGFVKTLTKDERKDLRRKLR